jgi:uncharacterized protein
VQALAEETELASMIEHAAHFLPAQGPITVFVHHNTLHAFEDLPFEEAVKKGASTFGCQPYLPEHRYREEMSRDRIRSEDLAAVLIDDLGDRADDLLGFLGTRFHLRLAMLEHPLLIGPTVELQWLVAETDALNHFRDEAQMPVRKNVITETRRWVMRDLQNGRHHGPASDDLKLQESLEKLFQQYDRSSIERWSDVTWESFALHLLWRVCQQGVQNFNGNTQAPTASVRHRTALLDATGEDSDSLVNELLIKFCASFLDQGFADWPLPDVDQGFYRCFIAMYGSSGLLHERWTRGLGRELVRLEQEKISPLDSIAESLHALGIVKEDREAYIAETLLALSGWAGMIWQMETNAEWTVRPAPSGTLIEYLAIRLLLERLALAHVARESIRFGGPLSDLRETVKAKAACVESVSADQRAFLVLELAQVLGWKPEDLYRMPKSEWAALVQEIDEFSGVERRRIYHLAYERRYRIQTLDAFAAHKSQSVSEDQPPPFQVVTCIDDREESFRRHLEEVDPACETFGAAGFYAVAMYYRGAADANFLPLCPVVIKPKHYVVEDVGLIFEDIHRRRAGTRRAIGAASHQFHLRSRSFIGGIATALVGSLASIPMILRILFPRATAQTRKMFGQLVQPPVITHLELERVEAAPSSEEGHRGYSVAEMTNIVEQVLRDIGLTKSFARLIIFTGHGSSSLNNPHESAYNCGACSGGRGGPNARVFALMANDSRVRASLVERGLSIPDTTIFLGAYHNTCDDSYEYFDLEHVPASHRKDFERASESVITARARNAHERCRRFESAEFTLTEDAALRHVESRAEDLSQARPEYNHATNALCFVGRRSRCRGLFLDRRAFLTSYDPTQDDEQATVLARVLSAAVPVCAGINLEYYFSTVDARGYGCGSKLPHNVTSLLGVMDGAASDLRPGLSEQMVEIHEPIRILFLIETTPDTMLRIMEANPTIDRLCRNQWVQLAVLAPDSSQIRLFRDGAFEPYSPESEELPQVNASVDWYRGQRDHLGFASIREEEPIEEHPSVMQRS